MTSNSPFKYVFWGIVILVATSLMGVTFMFNRSTCVPCGPTPFIHAAPLVPMYFMVVLYIALVGWLVYRDASKRGMDPWLWATVAVFVPYLIGVITVRDARRVPRMRTTAPARLQGLPELRTCPRATLREMPETSGPGVEGLPVLRADERTVE